jgi:ribose transport system permease protein
MKKELGIFTLLLVLCGVTAAMNPNFLSVANLTNNANLIGIYGIFGIGLGLIIITGGIDLSVGSMFALVGVLLPMALREWGWPWPIAVFGAIVLPMVLGGAHGALITRMKIQPFIVTLCGLMIYRSLGRFIAKDSTKGFGGAEGFETLKHIATGRLYGIPNTFIILMVIAIIMWFVLHRSTYGRYLFAVGRNEDATRFSGISTRTIIASTYVVAGLLTGIAGVLFAFYTNSISPSIHGNAYELYGIAAAVLGGCSLRGGEGSIIGILIGTAIFRVLQNLVNLLGIDSSLEFAVMGTVVLIGVLTDQFFQDRAARKVVRH